MACLFFTRTGYHAMLVFPILCVLLHPAGATRKAARTNKVINLINLETICKTDFILNSGYISEVQI